MLGSEESLSERGQLAGVIGDLTSSTSLILLTDSGDRCVNFDDNVTEVFKTNQDGEGNVIFSQMETSDLKIEQKANAFGTENEEGCVAASTIIYEDL